MHGGCFRALGHLCYRTGIESSHLAEVKPLAGTAGDVGSQEKVGSHVPAETAVLEGIRATVGGWRTAGCQETGCSRRTGLAEERMGAEQTKGDSEGDPGRTLTCWCAEGLGWGGR